VQAQPLQQMQHELFTLDSTSVGLTHRNVDFKTLITISFCFLLNLCRPWLISLTNAAGLVCPQLGLPGWPVQCAQACTLHSVSTGLHSVHNVHRPPFHWQCLCNSGHLTLTMSTGLGYQLPVVEMLKIFNWRQKKALREMRPNKVRQHKKAPGHHSRKKAGSQDPGSFVFFGQNSEK